VHATAVHAARLGLSVEAIRFPQPLTPHVEEMDAAFRTLTNVTETAVPHSHVMPFVLIARRIAVERAGGYAVLPGATSPLGVLGYVSAGLELAETFAANGWAPPDDVVVALGSGGTAVGLALGLALAGWDRTDVVGVRVADAIATNHAVLSVHAGPARAVLAAGGWFGTARPHLVIEPGYFGPGYGEPTPVGERATEEAATMGYAMEPTYTAKAFAAALDRWRAGRRVVFVQTYAPAVTPAATAAVSTA
jgi:D-cysteine desulfhydrase